MLLIFLIGTGGFLGTIARHLIQVRVHDMLQDPWLPYGTLIVNVTGCLLIGLIAGLAETRQIFGPEFRGFLLIGLLGGFTTFSAFSYDTMWLARNGETIGAVANVTLQVGLGLAAAWGGFNLARLAINGIWE